MLLFDTNPDRADRTLNESPMEALKWDENAWRNSAGQEKVPIAAGSWFLLHASDSDRFSTMLSDGISTMLKDHPDEFQRLPVIRFTGGDPTGPR